MMNHKHKVTPLYTFKFVGGGYNQVYADSKSEAVKKAVAEFPRHEVDMKSFKALRSQITQDNYYRELRLMFD